MSARRTAVEYDLFHTVDDRGCFQPSTHLQRANAASTSPIVYNSLLESTQSTLLSHIRLTLLIHHGNHISSIKRKFLARDFRWQLQRICTLKASAPQSRMKSGQHRTHPFAAARSPKGWDFEYVNRAFVETATGTGQSPWQPQLHKVPRYPRCVDGLPGKLKCLGCQSAELTLCPVSELPKRSHQKMTTRVSGCV